MENYEPDEIDITQWQPKIGDTFLISMKKIGADLWKGELYKSYGLYYKILVKEAKAKEMLNLGWELQKI